MNHSMFYLGKNERKSHIYQQDFTVLTKKRIVDCLLFVHKIVKISVI